MKGTTKGALIFASGAVLGAAVGWTHGAFLGYKVADAKHLERLQENLRRLADDLTAAQKEDEAHQPGADEDGFGGDAPEPYVKGEDEAEYVKGEPIINSRIDDSPLPGLRAVKTTPTEDQPKSGPVQVAPEKSGN